MKRAKTDKIYCDVLTRRVLAVLAPNPLSPSPTQLFLLLVRLVTIYYTTALNHV